MKKIGKLLLFLFTVFLLTAVAACSSGTSEEGAAENAEPEAADNEADEAVDGELYSINIAYGNQPGEPVDELAKKWKELAEEASGGRLELVLYPSSQLGAEKDVVEQAQMGNNVIVLAGYDFLMDYVPDAGILTAPYLVEDIDELLYLTETDWFEGLRGDLREQGIEVVTTRTVYGERHLLTNEKVETPEDLNGLKIRVPNNQMSIQAFEAMGAAATPTPLGELYTSLQQGLVDGAENPLPVLQGVKAHEVSKHLALTGHQKFITAWIGGTSFVETLPEDLVQILRETGDEASEFARAVLDEQTEDVLAEFEAAGVEINEVDTEAFKQLVQDVYEAFPSWTPGLYDEIKELLENQP
ncbi:C4-dicarboxylate TRAP transporter substrate-binding protein [Alkalihalobacillus oceani]|uniref:C4-dicarboxylate TRAP transporter substrate-binding protein n=1 Tax=Halalkalibacter oceani TaxID=1653776 RepID=UPI002041CECD|nr:C4-dicarboxylate TRAP transporter substrate-binding protein [Halalkalibacter oceani]MCM3761619.1 C4-dicarboxylate TRAP transporter substrate-binding protein [Halalkalibacter oceani]